MFEWETRLEKRIRGLKISAKKKLEGLRLMNELTDKALSLKQRIARMKLRRKH